jgi:hypothetical protein
VPFLGFVGFLMLEDAGGPSYFNNYQRAWQRRLFMRLQVMGVAAGCIFVPQAVPQKQVV